MADKNEVKEDNTNVLFKMASKAKHKQNAMIAMVTILFIVGYGVFFTSNYWFPGRDKVINASSFDRVYEWEDRDISLIGELIVDCG